MEIIVFGGGCFWCTEAVFQMLKGVMTVTSGYMGGTLPNPTYAQVCSGDTLYIEVIQVEYDSNEVSLEELLSVFFSSHDPTSHNQQGNDKGIQYKSAIFYSTEEQKQIIDDYIKTLEQDHAFSKPIVTQVISASKFYTAEESHQNYYRTNEDAPYCQVVINPKIEKLRLMYKKLLKE